MIGRTNTGGGGGTGGGVLAITYGTTRPARVAQNTIWIYTDKEIPSYALSAKRPESPVEYMAHVMIADSGNIVVNSVDGGNWIKIYPQFVSLYVNGVWQNVNAMIYQNGIWTQFSWTFSAVINITYPSGSVCTVSNGSTKLTAPDTSGTWACIVPNTGTWTVSITDGVETAEDTVEITADGQSESVGLDYILWVYNEGNEYTNVTGGWYKKYGSEFEKKSDHLRLKAAYGSQAVATTNNQIDTSGYSKMYFTISSKGGKEVVRFGLCTTVTTNEWETKNWVAYANHPSPSNGGAIVTAEVPLGGAQGLYYPAFYTHDSNNELLVYKIWLE